MKTNKWFGNQFRSSLYIRVKRGLGSVVGGYVKIASMLTLVYVVALLGAKYLNVPVYAEVQVVKEVSVEFKAPIMDKIAHCESSGTHKKDGQVVFKANTNGTVDIGKYQINSIWNKQATKLGYDLTNEADNKAFAMYLYANYGTAPWSASAKCWSK